MIHHGRHTANLDGDFVVFLIGMRINALWNVPAWLPVTRAMGRMLAELQRQPELGLLGGDTWFGRTTILVQYWRSLEQLLAYAADRDAAHLPAWRDFNRRLANTGNVGVWHETYCITAGAYETIYVNMPAFGLGKAGTLREATGPLANAAGRIRAGGGNVPHDTPATAG